MFPVRSIVSSSPPGSWNQISFKSSSPTESGVIARDIRDIAGPAEVAGMIIPSGEHMAPLHNRADPPPEPSLFMEAVITMGLFNPMSPDTSMVGGLENITPSAGSISRGTSRTDSWAGSHETMRIT